MRILLTNDDGLASPGLSALAAVLRKLGELVVVAPREEMSATGCAITLHGAVEAERVEFPGAAAAWAVGGTPSDCAKLAIRALLPGLSAVPYRDAQDSQDSRRRSHPVRPAHPSCSVPALCVSGLNRGPNVGVNVFYSGTVGAALESAVNGVPAVAVSRELGGASGPTGGDARAYGERLSATDAARLVGPLLEETLKHGLPPWHILNVNVPDRPAAEVRGIRLTRQGVSGFVERYREEAGAPGAGATGSVRPRRFVLEGEMRLRDCDGLTDAEALADGFVSVTPMKLDLTARAVHAVAVGRTNADWGWVAEAPLGRG